MKDKIDQIRSETLDRIAQATELPELEDMRVKVLGRKGLLTDILRGLGQVAPGMRKEIGQRANEVKQVLSEAIDQRKAELSQKESEQNAQKSRVDLTLPGRRPPFGHMHRITETLEEIIGIFTQLGFQVATGPDVETEYYNFDSLNTPSDHPARDTHDTFFVKPGVVLRTHTSPVQMRVMETHRPPVAIVAAGRAYRVDYDASHSPMFFQCEGLLVDEGVSFADLKGTLLFFAHRFFGAETKLRFRPHFFPFTEPSAEMDISCAACKGSGCRFCKHTGWVEILGCGMVDPAVFGYAGYDTEKYTGYAFGFGVDRMAVLRHGVDNLHHFYQNDLRFLEQF